VTSGVSLNDDLANDRTYLAWLRTGIALFGLGFVVSKIAYLINSDPQGLSDRDFYTIVGVLIVLSGAAITGLGLWQHRTVARSIARGGDEPALPIWPLLVTAISVSGAVLLSVLIVVSD
jgi:putative membrane protein